MLLLSGTVGPVAIKEEIKTKKDFVLVVACFQQVIDLGCHRF